MRAWAVLPIAGVLACFLIFCNAYSARLGGAGNALYFPGLGDALTVAVEAADGDTVYVTPRVNQPYIFALFYGQTLPEQFTASVEYVDERAAFRQVRRFAGYEFEDPSRAAVRVLCRDEAGEGEVLAQCGDFVVCR